MMPRTPTCTALVKAAALTVPPTARIERADRLSNQVGAERALAVATDDLQDPEGFVADAERAIKARADADRDPRVNSTSSTTPQT